MGNFPHTPVLVEEVIRHLLVRSEDSYIDGTVGAGGHAEEILKRLKGEGRLLGIDRDSHILSIAQDRLKGFGGRCLFLHGSYEDLEAACHALGTHQVDGILLDLGVSSFQLDCAERGFSFSPSKEAELDMRMDPTTSETAQSIINRASPREIERILRDYGEEPFAKRIARAIIEERRRRPIQTTTELASLVSRVIPRRAHPSRIHPATRTFQALRIAVNHELERLENFLEKVPPFLAPGGRLVILSYHSLEDRLVKRSFLRRRQEGSFSVLTKKPIRAGEEEIRKNPRARSVKMRVAEKMEMLL